MKKPWTVCLAIFLGLGMAFPMMGQNRVHVAAPTAANEVGEMENKRNNHPPQPVVFQTNALSIKNLGTSRNAYSNAFGIRQNIAASPSTNSVVVVHRASLPNSSGTVKADVSTDGGANWDVNKFTAWNNSIPTNAARYPRATLLHPPGYSQGPLLVSAQPLLDGSNGPYGGLGLSVSTLNGTVLSTQIFSSSPGRDTLHYNPSAVVSTNSKVFILDKNGDINSPTFSDTLLLTTGTWNGSSVFWSRQFISLPTGTGSNGKAGIADMTIAFDPTGQIGYIVALTHTNFLTDTGSTYLPVVLKTTDGGATWSSPVQLSIDQSVNAPLGLSTPIIASTGFEVSATVDFAGNCHIVTHAGELGSSAYSLTTTIGKSGTFHFKTDGNSLLSSRLLGSPGSLRGTYGSVSSTLFQDTRPCASRNSSGSALFFSWFETDSSISPENNQPDLMVVGFNPNQNKYSPKSSITRGTQVSGKLIFGAVAPQVFERINAQGKTEYELPVSFVELNVNGDVLDSAYHRYLSGVIINLDSVGNYYLIHSISSPGGLNICGNTPLNLVSTAINNNRWHRNGVLLGADTTQTISVSLPGTYYSVVGTDTSNSLFITQSNPPSISLPDTIITSIPVVLNPGIATSYVWNYIIYHPYSQFISGDTSSTITATGSGRYSVVATSTSGCSATDTCRVIFKYSQPAQVELPSFFNYQASLLNGYGEPWSLKTLDVRFSIIDSSQTIFSEKQVITTDFRGHFATKVGSGIPIIGSLSELPWWDGQIRNLKTEVDTNGTGQWISMGTTQLVSVPVSMYSHRSGDGRRSVLGSFTANGIIQSGKGFTITPLGNYEYEIEFVQPFSEVPHVFLSTIGSSGNYNYVIQRSISKVRIFCNGSEIQFEAKGY